MINNSKLFGPYSSLCVLTACFPKRSSAKGKHLPTLFWPHTYINISADVSTAFSLSVAYTRLEADWKYTTCFKGNAGSWHERGENAASKFTCLCWPSCARTVLPAQQPWLGEGSSQSKLTQLCQQTHGAQRWPQTILEVISKPREKKERTEGCCLTPSGNITTDDGRSCAA